MAVRPYKDKNGNIIPRCWVIDYYPEGRNAKRVRQIVHDVSHARALEIEAGLRQRRKPKNHQNPTINDVIPNWLAWLRMHRAPKTVESITWALKNLKPHFGHLTVAHIDEATIQNYQAKRKNTPRSCNLEIDWLKSLINWMVKRKMAQPLPFQIEKLPYKRPLPRVPSPAALENWLAHVENDGPWDKKNRKHQPGPKNALIWLMIRCGLRYTEAARLRWEHIDWEQDLIYITGKGSTPRIAVLPKEAREILFPLKQKNGWIAPNPKTGQPYKSMKTLFKTASERSGVDIKGPHTLRHYAGTVTLEATGDLRLVQATLGHTQIRTTELYTQISVTRLRQGQSMATDYTRQSDKNKK